jgi:5-methylcytosine-specific restriction endonuclease McrA
MKKDARINEIHSGPCPWRKSDAARRTIAFRLAERWGWVCWYCRLKLNPIGIFHIDHVVPRAAGGDHGITNLALSCEFCNRAKGTCDLAEFLEWLEFVRYGESSSLLRAA